MPAGDHDDIPRVRSWITPKAVKGGHVMDGAAVAGLPEAIRDSAFPIAADCFLAALTREEFDG